MKNIICKIFGHSKPSFRELGGHLSAVNDWDRYRCKVCKELLWTDDDFKAFGGIEEFWKSIRENKEYIDSICNG